MPDTTPILQLPYILPSQAQKHVTHNEAIRVLDVLVQLAVTARNLAVPPASPAQGDRYIVATGASGDWAGKVGQIALYENGAWQFFAPALGWTAWVTSEQVMTSYTGTAWVSQADGPFNVGQLGISATPDVTNRLSVSAPATLLNHAGAGHQLKLNKAAAADTASLLFQTGFSGRAEMGTAGSDDFAIKVSADGATFVTGLSVAAATGQVTLPAALRLGGQASDPVSPTDGTIWLNTTTGEVKMRSGGATVVIASGGVGVSDGDKGDITVSGTGAVWTIETGAITNAKLADVPTATFKGRIAAGTGPAADISAADAASILPYFTATERGVVPPSGGGTASYLRADGTWAAPAGGGGGAGSLGDLGVTATAAELNQLDGITLGTAAQLDTGTIEGTVPVLGVGGKLPAVVLPDVAIGDASIGAAKLQSGALEAAWVGSMIAQLAAGAIGTPAILMQPSVTTAVIAAGTTYAGSGLRYAAIINGNFFANGAPSGTWRALQGVPVTLGGVSNSSTRAALFVRVA